MSLSSEGVTDAWLRGRAVDPLFGDSRENGFGGSAHPDTKEGMETEALVVFDSSGELEMQYAMSLGYVGVGPWESTQYDTTENMDLTEAA